MCSLVGRKSILKNFNYFLFDCTFSQLMLSTKYNTILETKC